MQKLFRRRSDSNKTALSLTEQAVLVSPYFDACFYLEKNPDVLDANIDPLEHFLRVGWKENRDPSNNFSMSSYLSANEDVRTASINPLVHYASDGQREGRLSIPSVKTESYQLIETTENGAVKSEEDLGYIRHLIEPYFDEEFYVSRNGDVIPVDMTPINHFIKIGAQLMYDPSAVFCIERYHALHPDCQRNPLLHFVEQNNAAGDFMVDWDFYQDKRNLRSIVEKSFDAEYYRAQYPDVKEAGVDPLDHYLFTGWREYRNPCATFDTHFYIEEHAHLIEDGCNPLVHYQTTGKHQGLKTQNTDLVLATDFKEVDQAPVVEIERDTRQLESEVQTPWTVFKEAVSKNYGVASLHNDDASVECHKNIIAVVDRYLTDTKKIYGWIASESSINADSNAYLHIASDMVSSCKLGLNRLDISDFFGYNNVCSFEFEVATDRRQSDRPVMYSPDLLEACNSDRTWLGYEEFLIPIVEVNGVDRTAYQRNFRSSFVANQMMQSETSRFEMSMDAKIALIAKNIDIKFYSSQSSIDFRTELQAATHYNKLGIERGLDPTSWFSTSYYKSQFQIDYSNMNPFFHYLSVGRSSGFKPNADQRGQLISKSDTAEGEGVAAWFDRDYYAACSPDVVAAGIDLLTHYMNGGWKEHRDPSPYFSTRYYAEQNTDVIDAGLNPFSHYVENGRFENRRPHPDYISMDVPVMNDPRRIRQILRFPCVQSHDARITIDGSSELKVAVHIHVYYVELLEMLLNRVRSIGALVQIILTTDDQLKVTAISNILNSLDIVKERITIRVVENRGRDVWPMLEWLQNSETSFDLVLHLHTKKSIHLGDYAKDWLDHILNNLLGSHGCAQSFIEYFKNDPACGVLYPIELRSHHKYLTWGLNRPIAKNLFDRLGVESNLLDSAELDFPGGNMFWFRPDAIRQLIDGVSADDFPAEPVGVDGTVAHAIERCVPQLAEYNGFYSIKSEMVAPAYMPLVGIQNYYVSVIIPMFNSAEWLHSVMNSLINQGSIFVNLEILLVDNNSTDSTLNIAQYYEYEFANVRVFSEPQQGAGNARNTGLKYSNGEYVMFLDADDVLVDNCLEELYTLAVSGNAEMVISRLKFFDLDQFSQALPWRPNTLVGSCINIAKYSDAMNNYSVNMDEKILLKSIFCDFGPCAKLFSRKFVINKALGFPEGVNYEDNLFIYDAYLSAKRIYITNSVTYLYRRTKVRKTISQSMRTDEKSTNDALYVFGELLKRRDAVHNTYLREIITEALANRAQSLLNDHSLDKSIYEKLKRRVMDDPSAKQEIQELQRAS